MPKFSILSLFTNCLFLGQEKAMYHMYHSDHNIQNMPRKDSQRNRQDPNMHTNRAVPAFYPGPRPPRPMYFPPIENHTHNHVANQGHVAMHPRNATQFGMPHSHGQMPMHAGMHRQQYPPLPMQHLQAPNQPTFGMPFDPRIRAPLPNHQMHPQPVSHPNMIPNRHHAPLEYIDQPLHSDYHISRAASRESLASARTYLKTPSNWGLHRYATPIEIRGTMTTNERYKVFPSKSTASIDFEPYSQREYRNLQSRDRNMRLPRGLGASDDDRWKLEVLQLNISLTRGKG